MADQHELRDKGLRLTPQRELVLSAVRELGHATPEEVAELTYFLCDPKMRHLTGTEINLDGGKKTTI